MFNIDALWGVKYTNKWPLLLGLHKLSDSQVCSMSKMVNRLVLKHTIIKRFINIEDSDEDESGQREDNKIEVLGSGSERALNQSIDSDVNSDSKNKHLENFKVFVTIYGEKVERLIGRGPDDNPFVQIQQLNQLMNCQNLNQMETFFRPKKSGAESRLTNGSTVDKNKTKASKSENKKSKKKKKNLKEKTTREESMIEVEPNSSKKSENERKTKPKELAETRTQPKKVDQKSVQKVETNRCDRFASTNSSRDDYLERLLYLDGIKRKNKNSKTNDFFKCIICDVSLTGFQLALDHSLSDQHSKVCKKWPHFL